MRVLGIDPAVRNTGYAILEGQERAATLITHGTITVPARYRQSFALEAVCTGIKNLILQYGPTELAVEGVIYVQSHSTAITMGAARAAALIAGANAGLRVFEYSPRKVKKAVVGKGTAGKEQVAFMVRALLGMEQTPSPDAADAIAIALAHLQSSDPLKAALLDRREV